MVGSERKYQVDRWYIKWMENVWREIENARIEWFFATNSGKNIFK